jgi:hypothetical protein
MEKATIIDAFRECCSAPLTRQEKTSTMRSRDNSSGKKGRARKETERIYQLSFTSPRLDLKDISKTHRVNNL